MVVLLFLFILAYIIFTIYAFYDMLVNGSLVLFLSNLVGYIIFWYVLDKETRNDNQKDKQKDTDSEITHEESSIDDSLYEEPSYTDDSYKEECLTDESIEFDVYLDKDIAKQNEWQDAFFRNTKHYDKR